MKDAAVSYRSALRQEETLDVTRTTCYQVDVDETQGTRLENGLTRETDFRLARRYRSSVAPSVSPMCCESPIVNLPRD